MDRRKGRGGDHKSDEFKSKTSDEVFDFTISSQKTGDALGISRLKVEKARTVMRHGDKETKQAIEPKEMP